MDHSCSQLTTIGCIFFPLEIKQILNTKWENNFPTSEAMKEGPECTASSDGRVILPRPPSSSLCSEFRHNRPSTGEQIKVNFKVIHYLIHKMIPKVGLGDMDQNSNHNILFVWRYIRYFNYIFNKSGEV